MLSQHGDLKSTEWQERLLPLMRRMVVGLTIFFFVASFAQLAYLHWRIGQNFKSNIGDFISLLSIGSEPTSQDILAISKLKAIVLLEADILERRYHQANIALMARMWIQYLGFVTGMVLAMVGAAFILGKLRGPSSEFDAKVQVTEFSFKSASPGVILSGLGVVLMLTTIMIHHEIGIHDIPIYTQGLDTLSSPSGEPTKRPPLELPK